MIKNSKALKQLVRVAFMEWNLKMPPWDFAESHQETETRLFSLVGSSSESQQQRGGRTDCSIDLKLRGLGDLGLSHQWRDQTLSASASMVTSSGSSRRTRAPSSNGHIAACSVDGCLADLSKCRDYHKRHKVCEVHSKTPIVVVGGREQRFCQQCSRFHSLSEFDEGKRSCRKRLDGHNKRRRKPQVDTLNPGNLLTNQGTRYCSHPQIYPTTIPDSNWINFSAKSEQGTLHPHCLPLQFPFLQQSEAAHGSNRAFSLLSSSAQSSHLNLSPMMYSADKISSDQPLQQCSNSAELYPCFHSSACTSTAGMPCVQMEDENAGSNVVSEANGTNLHCQDMFQDGGKVLFEGTSETPSNHWEW